MYCNFFQFSEKPFDVTPDPKFLYLTAGHREALSALVYGIRERKGFIVLVGEVGTGKTTLLNTLLGRFDDKTRVAFIFNTDVTFEEILNMALFNLGLAKPEEHLSKVEAVQRLNDFATRQLARGGNVVLLVDEAQNLDRSAMENLRLLSNLETRKHKLIQIVLSGQPELDGKFGQPELRQLVQRISIKRYISPLSEEETYQYIGHRLRVAEYGGSRLFCRRAEQLIWEYSGGVPRKINVLCDNALLIAYALRKKTIRTREVEEAIRDLPWNPFSDSGEGKATPFIRQMPSSEGRIFRSRFAMVASLVLVAGIVFVGGLLLGRSRHRFQGGGPVPISPMTGAEVTVQKDSADRFPALVQSVSQEHGEMTKNVSASIASQGSSESVSGPIAKKLSDHTVPDGEVAETGLQKATVPLELWGSNTTESQARETYVVVKKGDSLSKIITKTYGRYDKALLNAVLQENPEIESPERIMVGQTIKLPEE